MWGATDDLKEFLTLPSADFVQLHFFIGWDERVLEFLFQWLMYLVSQQCQTKAGQGLATDFTAPCRLIQSSPEVTRSMQLLSFMYPICLFIAHSLVALMIFPAKQGKLFRRKNARQEMPHSYSVLSFLKQHLLRLRKKNETMKQGDVCWSVYTI